MDCLIHFYKRTMRALTSSLKSLKGVKGFMRTSSRTKFLVATEVKESPIPGAGSGNFAAQEIYLKTSIQYLKKFSFIFDNLFQYLTQFQMIFDNLTTKKTHFS